MCWRGVGGEVLYSPVLSVCPTDLMPLDRKFHKSFSVFFFPLSGTEWLEWATVKCFTSPRSDNGGVVDGWFQLRIFSWGQAFLTTECSGIFQRDSLPS